MLQDLISVLARGVAIAAAAGCLTGCEIGGGGGGGSGSQNFGANDPNLYVAFGDSITAAGSSGSYPAILAAMLGKRVVNEGIPGTTAGFGAARVDSLLLAYKPGYLLILYGANDAIGGDNPTATIGGLRAIIAAAKQNQTVPVLATLTPMFFGHAAFEGRVEALNIQIRTLADEEGVSLADLEKAFGGNPAYLQDDGLHPNGAGLQVIADTFASAL